MPLTPTAAKAEGERLTREARESKREVGRHRRRLRDRKQRLEQLRRQCDELGFELVIEPDPTETPKEGQSDSNDDSTA